MIYSYITHDNLGIVRGLMVKEKVYPADCFVPRLVQTVDDLFAQVTIENVLTADPTIPAINAPIIA